MRRSLIFIASLFSLSVFFEASARADVRPLVVTSVQPLTLLLGELCGSHCRVESIIPVGTSEHHWEPSVSDLIKLKSAKAYLAVGLGFDLIFLKKIFAPKSLYQKSIYFFGEKTNPRVFDWSTRASPMIDPHVWFDPRRMADALPGIAQFLARELPEGAASFKSASEIIGKRLRDLDRDLDTRVGVLKQKWGQRKLLILHDTLGYWVERYGLPTTALVSGGTGHELSAKSFGNALRDAKKQEILAIVVEREGGAAKNLAREMKVPLVVVDFAGAQDKKDYFDWLLSVVRSLEGVGR